MRRDVVSSWEDLVTYYRTAMAHREVENSGLGSFKRVGDETNGSCMDKADIIGHVVLQDGPATFE